MEVLSAIRLVHELVLMPGWELTATDHTNRFEGSICLRVDYPARETARANAEEGYPEENRPYAQFPLVVIDLDDIGLYRAIVAVLAEIWIHEVREYLRVKPTFWAPFHPHRVDGMRRWQEGDATYAASVQIRADLQFGIS